MRFLHFILLAVAAVVPPLRAQVTSDVPAGRPDAIVDLTTRSGVALVRGTWRYADARIVSAVNRSVGPDLRPSGPAVTTYDIDPHAGAREFDDRAWQTIEPQALESRRTNGKLAFAWYRITVRVPDRIGSFDPSGSSAVLEVVLDDYSEIWVNGQLPVTLGQSGGGTVRGWNAPNRVVLGRDVRPGQEFQIAIFGANGPLSRPPENFVWIRSATIDFHRDPARGVSFTDRGSIRRLDPAFDRIAPLDAHVEKIAGGFQFTEGPVWHPDGYLLFSDPNANTIYRYGNDGAVSVFRTKSGYAGTDVGEYKQPGANGLTLDAMGRVTINEHGRRRVVRLEKNGVITVLADNFQGRRLNSPNDLVYKSDGSLYFTDPPFGLPQVFADARKELEYSGVYRLANGKLQLLTRELTGPNGLAFSPDERFLYVDNWDEQHKVIMRYPVMADGTLGAGTVFLDVTTSDPGDQAWDGLKVDREGHVYAAGPGGVWVLSPEGKHLGTISAPETPANIAWGDADGRTLYLTARSSLYRVRLNIPGLRPTPTGLATTQGVR